MTDNISETPHEIYDWQLKPYDGDINLVISGLQKEIASVSNMITHNNGDVKKFEDQLTDLKKVAEVFQSGPQNHEDMQLTDFYLRSRELAIRREMVEKDSYGDKPTDGYQKRSSEHLALIAMLRHLNDLRTSKTWE